MLIWPFKSKEAKKLLKECLSNGTLKRECGGDRYNFVENLCSVEYEGLELKVGYSFFGFYTGSRYFWLFKSWERKWLWKKLVKAAGEL